MICFPNAKINLGLNIVSRRADGYHNIETVFYPIALKDSLEIVPAGKNMPTTLSCYGNPVNCPMEKNLVTKAFRLLQAEFGIGEVEMHLIKHIPDGAGLGGGSSDASNALIILNKMFHLGLSDQQLAVRAATLGADCAFFVYNRTMMATGIGNEFSSIDLDLSGYHLVLVKPDVAVSTAQAYSDVTPRPSATPIPDILKLPLEQWRGLLKNDFEQSVFAQYPSLAEIKQTFYDCGAVYASMSGSGSSIFGIFSDANMAEKAFSKLQTYNVFNIIL